PRAFWHTRPISGGGLLLAKALAAFLLFGLAPVLVSLPWWLTNGLAGADLALAAFELLLVHVALILPAFLLASVVDSFGRAVLWSIVQYGAIVGLTLFAGQSEEQLTLLEPGLELSREVLAAGIATLGMVALIVWQFRRRHQVAVIAGFVLLHVAVAVIWRCSSWNFVPKPAGWTELNAARYKNIALQPNVTAEYSHARYRSSKPDPAHVRLTWPVTGLPPDLYANSYHTTLSYADSRDKAVSPNEVRSYVLSKDNPAGEMLRNHLGLPLKNIPDDDSRPPSILINHYLDLAQAERIKLHPQTATTTLHLSLSRPEISQIHPLTTGLAFTDPHGSMRIIKTDTHEADIHVALSSTEPSSLLQLYVAMRRSDYQNPQRSYSPAESHTEDYIFDSASMRSRNLRSWNTQLFINGVLISRSTPICTPDRIRRDGKWVPSNIDPAIWRAGLRVVRITYHEEARLLLTGRTEGLVIAGSSEAPAPKL
ncbi:MAG: hypothetical protein RIQ79_36, partial [Verrucomicrobiota bacterium]